MKISSLFTIKISIILSVLFFLDSISANCQQFGKQEYVIDASQRQQAEELNSFRPLSINLSADKVSTAVLINKRIYDNEILNKILPFINENHHAVHSIEVITDKLKISSYSKDEKITTVIKFSVCNKVARQIKREHLDLVRK